MLVLSRRAAETVDFPTLGIRVEILRCSSKSVRVGIEAPRDIQVIRGELANRLPEKTQRGFLEAITPSLTFDKASSLLQAQISEAESTLRKLQSLNKDQCGNVDSDRVTELMRQLRRIDSQATETDAQHDNARKLRALLVDDNANETKLLAGYLKIKGFDVVTASNGKEALEKISVQEPDVVLLDMTMPKFDGSWTISQIRSQDVLEEMTVFAVSGKCASESDVTIGPDGVNAWFRKPLNPEALAHEIKRSFDAADLVA
jgi:carbon storage regulator CsrA